MRIAIAPARAVWTAILARGRASANKSPHLDLTLPPETASEGRARPDARDAAEAQ